MMKDYRCPECGAFARATRNLASSQIVYPTNPPRYDVVFACNFGHGLAIVGAERWTAAQIQDYNDQVKRRPLHETL